MSKNNDTHESQLKALRAVRLREWVPPRLLDHLLSMPWDQRRLHLHLVRAQIAGLI